MTTPALSVRIEAHYGDRTVLEDVRFDLRAGEILGLVGTSGAGKSTLVLSLLGLLPRIGGRAAGEVLLEGCDLLAMRERDLRSIRGLRVALIPQSPLSALNSHVSLRAHFREAWRAHDNSGAKSLDSRLQVLLAEVQLPSTKEFLNRRPGQISVGQAQRVMIALALLHRPAILIADEPTSALDPVTQAEILKLLMSLNRQHGTTMLYISHDLISVLQLCDRLAVLDRGRIRECLPVCEIEHACEPATRSLLEALPVPAHILVEHRGQLRAS